jgi:predicted nucleic acid-binding Zn ribbon protein
MECSKCQGEVVPVEDGHRCPVCGLSEITIDVDRFKIDELHELEKERRRKEGENLLRYVPTKSLEKEIARRK